MAYGDMTPGDMAFILAEREFYSISWLEVQKLAMEAIQAKWIEEAVTSPAKVERLYKQFIEQETH